MLDLLLPRTDTGVAVQAALVVLAGAAFVWSTRRNEAWRIFAIGSFVLALGLLGVRAVH